MAKLICKRPFCRLVWPLAEGQRVVQSCICGAPAEVVRRLRLILLSGGAPAGWSLEVGYHTVGRSSSQQLPHERPTIDLGPHLGDKRIISRQHARLSWEGGQTFSVTCLSETYRVKAGGAHLGRNETAVAELPADIELASGCALRLEEET